VSAVRGVVAAVAVALALVLQVSVFGPLAWEGVVPNLCLLVVVAGALTLGPQFAVVRHGSVGGPLSVVRPPRGRAGLPRCDPLPDRLRHLRGVRTGV